MATALAHGEITASWARQICRWTDQLPGDHRADADQILIAAATAGATLRDLAGLAREMIERAGHGQDGDDGGFGDRALWLQTTLGGAGTVRGELTGRCAAALAVVLDALGKRRGPEDTRSAPQRRHDALEDACDRLIRAGMIPGRDGGPPQVQVHSPLPPLSGHWSRILDQPPPVCEAHHLTPWARGGPTSLDNLTLLCRFHHLIAVHHWGWTLTRNRDGTTTAKHPDGRSLHSHQARAA